MQPDDIARIVAGLSEQQVHLLMDKPSAWPFWQFEVAKELVELGLGRYESPHEITLDTPTGLAVRAALKERGA